MNTLSGIFPPVALDNNVELAKRPHLQGFSSLPPPFSVVLARPKSERKRVTSLKNEKRLVYFRSLSMSSRISSRPLAIQISLRSCNTRLVDEALSAHRHRGQREVMMHSGKAPQRGKTEGKELCMGKGQALDLPCFIHQLEATSRLNRSFALHRQQVSD